MCFAQNDSINEDQSNYIIRWVIDIRYLLVVTVTQGFGLTRTEYVVGCCGLTGS